MSDAIEVTVDRIGSGGDGLASWPGGDAAVLPFTLPGERVRAHATGRRGPLVLAEAEAILAPSPDRVAAPCAHFGTCGGCALQHWAPEPYRAWKRGRVVEALSRAGFRDAPVGEAAVSPPRSRRRADLAIRQGAAAPLIGFHARGASGGGAPVVDMRECHVLHPRLFALVAPLRALLPRLRAFRREGSAVVNLLDTGPDLLLRTDAPLDAADRRVLAEFGAAQGLPRIAWALKDGPAETAAQNGSVSLTLGGVAVAPAPGAFLQATPEGEAAIAAAVLAGLPAKRPPKARIADLYAGLGTLSLPLAALARVEAFEGAAEAVAALAAGANKAQARVAAKRRDLARQPLAPPELAAYAAVVLDPPYAGAPEQSALLARSAVSRVVYISCNPGALSRDAALFARSGWRVLAATPVDQFLWSPHVEAVAVLARG
ncbi:class I SAM-dependent RNA methyltransferase [Roseomonas sp. OT10]|uniref:class I SAM-dependent RNA methyltransferase n=1 Tax=Roseomonas cutis TaxID=2897332 RepID=UPI001E2C04BA|nr:class I SAM-dependent RNA methyltransferase [Roseomonas sp. OT10]UFN48549.1 class I SAM-dependent RNA methyltransferase [Roseomonas sp. OT10]